MTYASKTTVSPEKTRIEIEQTLHDQALRQIWRALLLVIKAKLVAVEQGIMALEEEFLAYLVLPTGETMAERLMPDIDQLYISGNLPTLLPAPHAG